MAEVTEQLSKRVEDAMKLTEGMTAIELASYSKAMRDKFGITAAPVAVAGVAGAGGVGAAAEEERFRRIKHWAGFPAEAIKYCLREAQVEVKDLDHIAINRNPRANLLKKSLYAFARRPSLDAVRTGEGLGSLADQ